MNRRITHKDTDYVGAGVGKMLGLFDRQTTTTKRIFFIKKQLKRVMLWKKYVKTITALKMRHTTKRETQKETNLFLEKGF